MKDAVMLSSVYNASAEWQPFPDTAVVRLDIPTPEPSDERALLSENEKHLFARLVGEKRRRSFLAGRLAAKQCAAALPSLTADTSPADIDIGRSESGAPMLRVRGIELPDIFVSISHGGSFAVAGVMEGTRIGLDVEPVSPRCAALRDAFAAAEEIRILTAETSRETPEIQLTRLFSAKEAAAKCLGSHMYFAFHHYRLISTDADSLWLTDLSRNGTRHCVQTVIKNNHVFSRLLCPKTD